MNELEREVETLLGIQAGMTIALAALIATHPDYDALQLKIAALLEHVAPKTLWPTLSERQQDVAVKYVEFLQRIETSPKGSDPLTQLGFRWRDR